MSFHSAVSTDGVTKLSTRGKRVGRRALRNDTKVMLLDGSHCLEAIRRLCLEGDVSMLQQQILVCVNIRRDRVVISEAIWIKLSKLAAELTEFVYLILCLRIS